MRAKEVPQLWKRQGLRAVLEARALFKRALSYRTRTWSLSDYPVRLVKLDVSQLAPWSEPQIMYPWGAQIINWCALCGGGVTKAEAHADLSARFDEYRESHGSLPRPGKHVPVEFAPRHCMEAHSELAEDFVVRVLGFVSDWVWLSDESSLRDFAGLATTEEFFRKIKSLYGVDVSDVEGANIGVILDRIDSERPRP